jgi:hypothetical protein
MMNRSATSPAPLSTASRPIDGRSPDFHSNMDSAFPRFPTNRSATPGTPQSAKPQARDRLEPNYNQRYAEPSPLFAPLSPRTNGGENITRRMDNIAPGPFDGRRSPSATRSPMQETPPLAKPNTNAQDMQPLGHRRTDTQSSTRSTGSMSKLRTSLKSISSGFSNRSGSSSSRNRSSGANEVVPPLPSTDEQPEGIDAFLGRLQSEAMRPTPLTQDSRSKTYPIRSESQDRRPPPRPRRPSTRDLPPENISELKVSDFVSQSDSRLSSREPIYPRSQSATRQNDVRARSRSPQPPVRPAVTANDAPLAPLHTPSDSGLSDGSYASYRSQSVASSRSSPPESEVGHSRQASKIGRSDNFTEEAYQRAASPEPIVESRPPPTQPHRREESVNRLKPISYEPIPRVLSPGYASAPESPMDPAIQFGIGFERQPRTRNPVQNVERSPPRRMKSQEPESRRAAPASKGNCRGCSKPIIGKSVKDSSGRLTGRYHKDCFVCRTCSDPFPTAEFYVFNNSPYCEQHYHELNGSLCRSCNLGIEGQYLETDQRQKFHPRCFTCSTCNVVLSADYYEVGGQKYCDRHAQRAAPQQNYLGPGDYRPRNMQKRRTRLMMM